MPSQIRNAEAKLIAANIRRGLAEKALSNRRASVLLDVSETQFWRWREGKTAPHADKLPAIADLLFDGDVNQLYWPAEDSAA